MTRLREDASLGEAASCPMPRAAKLFDTPHTMAPDMQREFLDKTCGFDLAGCNVTTIVLALNEFDLERLARASHAGPAPMGHRFDTWPDNAKAIFLKELREFDARNKGVKIAAITQAIGGEPKCFILCLHWRPKA